MNKFQSFFNSGSKNRASSVPVSSAPSTEGIISPSIVSDTNRNVLARTDGEHGQDIRREQQPQPPKIGPKDKAWLEIVKSSIQVVNRANVPGVAAAGTAVLRIITGVEQWHDASAEWADLLEDLKLIMATLKLCSEKKALTMEEIEKKGGSEEDVMRFLQPLNKELEELENKINEANTQQSDLAAFWKFWNAPSHLDSAKAFKQNLRDAIQRVQAGISFHTAAQIGVVQADIRTFIGTITKQLDKGDKVSDVIQRAESISIDTLTAEGSMQTVSGNHPNGVEQYARGIKIGTLSGKFQSVS